MSAEDQIIPRVMRERDEIREAGDSLARGVALFIHAAEADGIDALALKRKLFAYMKKEALVDRKIYTEMSELARKEEAEKDD